MGLKETLDELKARAAAEAAKAALDKLAGEALDDLEKALLGKVGAADEILGKDDGSEDPLERIRRQRGMAGTTPAAGPTSAPAPSAGATPRAPATPAPKPDTAADREARARAELAELKRKMGKS